MHDVAVQLADWVAKVAWLPGWAQSLLLALIAVAVALAVHAVTVAALKRLLKARDEFWRSLVARTLGPGRLSLIVIGLSIAATVAPLTKSEADAARQALLIVFILLLGWIALTAMDIGAALYLRGYRTDVDDNLLARKHLTQVKILRRAASILVGLITVGLALMTIGSVRQLGVSLLAAGGAAGVIVGLALQPLLANLVAGVQIALTQPIRIDDAVIVETEWGWIEEINATYVVVRLWDLRRMILPLTYFIEKPFQNWTRESASLIGTAMLYVDFAAPVDAMRAQLAVIAKGSALWDGKVVNLAVTDVRDRVIEVRCLVSGRNAGQTFDLRCEVREKMLAWLKSEHPEALPRERLAFSGEGQGEMPVRMSGSDGANDGTRTRDLRRDRPAL